MRLALGIRRRAMIEKDLKHTVFIQYMMHPILWKALSQIQQIRDLTGNAA